MAGKEKSARKTSPTRRGRKGEQAWTIKRDAAGVKEIDDEVDFIIKVSNAMGMKMLITVPAFDVGPLSIEEIQDEAVQRLRYLADKLARHGIRISLEFCGVPTCAINQFGTAYDVVETVDRDNVGITLDTFHFRAMGSKWEDLERAARRSSLSTSTTRKTCLSAPCWTTSASGPARAA